MTDWPFVLAGWGVILGGAGAYTLLLLRRLRNARQASLAIRRAADEPAPRERE
ncbi:MAG TPA: hypothetical protein VF013_03135 [Candidatus Limnocylindria bacterium]